MRKKSLFHTICSVKKLIPDVAGGDALERASEVDVVIFDKTGTLTLGRPSVISCNLLDEALGQDQLCRLMGAAESASEHPLARAILDYCSSTLHLNSSLGHEAGASTPALDSPQLPVSYHSTASLGGEALPQMIPSSQSWAPALRLPNDSHAGKRLSPTGGQRRQAFPMGHDARVDQGMGIACWVDVDSAGLTQSQQIRYCDRASGISGRQEGAAGPSTDRPSPSHVPVVIGNRIMMHREGVRLPEGLEDLLVPEVCT